MATFWMRPGLRKSDPNPQRSPSLSGQAGRPPATTTKDNELLLEHEILGDHRSHATGATQLRCRDSEVKQGEQELLHVRVSVGQTPCAMQRLSNPGISARIDKLETHTSSRLSIREINPNLKLPANSVIGLWVPAGTITVGMGNNIWAGGTNKAPSAISFRCRGQPSRLTAKRSSRTGD